MRLWIFLRAPSEERDMADTQTNPSPAIPGLPPNTVLQNRVAGLAIGAGSALSVFLMLHHPRSTGVIDLASAGEPTRHLHGLDPVHAIFIAVLAILTYGFMGLADQMGGRKPLVRAGLIAYLLGMIAMLNAIMASTVSANQNFAITGIVAISAAMLFWSIALLHRKGAPRLAGVVGLAGSAGPAMLTLPAAVGLSLAATSGAVLTSHPMVLDVTTMTLVVAVQAAWNLVIAVMLFRGTIRPD
jgi:hypothetical protein